MKNKNSRERFSLMSLAKFIYDSIQIDKQRKMLFITMNWKYEIIIKKVEKIPSWEVNSLYIDEALTNKL